MSASPLDTVMDPYDRSASLSPMVLVLLPLLLAVSPWLPSGIELPGLVGGAAVAIAVSTFLTQIARDQGKRREKELFRLWGGRPSDRALSYGGRVFSEGTLSRCHKKLRTLDPGLRFPVSSAEERQDPKAAKAAYAAASELLVARTHAKDKFPVLFAENVNYGFRRNLWGMKPAGISTSLIGLAAGAAKLGAVGWAKIQSAPVPLVVTVLCSTLLVFWWLRVKPLWVKIAADGYAKQLVDACEALPATPEPTTTSDTTLAP